jgi:protein arginine N-methyltransferase 1
MEKEEKEVAESKTTTNKTAEPMHDIASKAEENCEVSDEPGFTGDTTTWFNDEEFRKQFVGSLNHHEVKDSYFSSYSHFGIHEDMLKDEVRTKSYMLACKNNAEQFKDKIVLDVGCGTGILSIFAAQAGAKHVYGIDNAEIADFARAIVEKNGFADRITIIKGKVEEVTLPVDKVDIIISEWMGYFLLYESMLDTVLYARDKYLAVDGLMLPDRVRLNIVAIEDSQYKQDKFGFWMNVYGINMECIRSAALAEPLVDIVGRELTMSSIGKILDLDLYKATVKDLEFAKEFELKIKHNDNIYALVGWFDVFFERLNNPVRFTTSPFSRKTHWRQTVFYLPEPIKAKAGGVLSGVIGIFKDTKNHRHINIKIKFEYADNETKVGGTKMYKLR